MKKWVGMVVILLALAVPGFAAQQIGVVATIAPLAEFVKEVGGERVFLTIMVPPGASPHTYEPTPGQLKALGRAKLYVKVGSGIEFERVWLDKVLAVNRTLSVCDASRGVELIEQAKHRHGDHPHQRKDSVDSGQDPHIWTSPANAITMTQNICDGLIAIDPENEAHYRAGAEAYIQKLRDLKSRITKDLETAQSRKFMVFHAAWGYFAREFSLEQIALEVGGKEPSARDMTRLIRTAREHQISIVFAEPQFNAKSAQIIAKAIGGRVVLLDPLAENYLDNMETMAAAVAGSLK
ncbi:MAG TPA: zinc ABC transporter substrate-binding protein [Smithellaceae bacterium]|nr:zinc ABC transporter substrate-binding protein [Smithellaceae bacterium]